MCDNQTQYSKEFLQQVEELKKEIEEVLRDERIDNNAKAVLTRCVIELNNARQDNLDKTIAEIKGTLGFIYINQGKIEQAKQHWLNIQENHDLETYAQAQFNLGLFYHKQDDIEQAKQYWLNIQEKHDLKQYAMAQVNLGFLYHQQGDIEQTKQCWLNIQEKHDLEQYAMAQFNLGVLYDKQGDIEQAKQHYQNIQEKHNLEQYAKAQFNLGVLYDKQGNIEQTKQHWLNIQEKHDLKQYAMAQVNLGVLYDEQGDIEQAKQHWLNIQENHDLKTYAYAQFNLGLFYHKQDDIGQAKQHWKNIQEKHDFKVYAAAQLNLGTLYQEQNDIKQAKQHWLNIQGKHDIEQYACAQFNLALLYHKQGDIKQAKRHYQNIQEKHNEEVYSQAQFNLGSILDEKRNVKNKISHYLQVKQEYVLLEYDEILKFILKYYAKSISQTVPTAIENALNNNLSEPYLIYITRDIFSITHKKIKKDLILLLKNFIEIRYLLQVNNPNKKIYLFEDRVAHYAKPTLAETLLEKKNNNKFRIYSTAKMNDPTEGKILYQYFNYLFQQQKTFWTIEKSSEWASFIGCFTLNHDSLNQFRLYGKEDGQEATGVSIIFKPEFFAKTHQNVFYILTSNIDLVTEKINNKDNLKEKLNEDKGEDSYLPLYRCIYLDPEKQIKDKENNKQKTYLKVAHRDEITFYRENNQGKGRDIDEWEKYKKEIEEIEKQVAENLENILKIMIDIFNLCENKKQNISEKEQTQTKSIIDLILLQLSCLVKHAAYQEEQECRVLKFLPFTDDRINRDERDKNRLYTDYASIVDKVEKIYLSPGAKDYADIFRYMGVGKVELSSNPFRTAG